MELETERVFEFENVKIKIREKFTESISGEITQHGAHLWPAAPLLARVEYFVIFEELIFTVTSKILRILAEHIEPKDSPDSKLQIESTCSISILNILEVIAKTTFLKIGK